MLKHGQVQLSYIEMSQVAINNIKLNYSITFPDKGIQLSYNNNNNK